MSPKKDFIKTLELLSRKHDTDRAFCDFLEVSAISLAQAFMHDESLEKRYLSVVQKYTRDELNQMAKLLALTVDGLEEKPHDFLGDISGEIGLLSASTGQFFTPYHICQMIAQMTINETSLSRIEDYMMLNEPCCGGGAMIIAAYEHMRSLGFDTQRKAFIIAQDISPKAFHMAYVQLGLLDIPGQVILGDTLKLESRQCWATPAAYLYGWNHRLQRNRADVESGQDEIPVPQFQLGEQIQLL